MTCRPWYTLTLPYLHYYLTTHERAGTNYKWPKPLWRSFRLGLLPIFKQLCIRDITFTPEKIGIFTLYYFSKLKSLQELGIDRLDLPAFIPQVKRYFEHFAISLRFLALKDPKGSSRQILYFIGFFPNLQDLNICYSYTTKEEDTTADPTPNPSHKPPLCGRLTLRCFAREKLVQGMITHFGGLRFRFMELFEVACAKLLLDACAKTLETLRLDATDSYGEGFSQGNMEAN